MGFAAMILLANALGPSEYGRFSWAVAWMWIAAELSDGGVTTTSIRLSAPYFRDEIHRAHALFKGALWIRIGIAGCLLTAGAVVSRFALPPAVRMVFWIGFLGAIGLSLWLFVSSYLQARQWFHKNALLNGTTHFLKLVGIVGLVLLGKMALWSSLSVYALAPFLGVGIGLGWMPLRALWRQPSDTGTLREFVHFSKWVLLVLLCDVLYERLDILMLSHLRGPWDVGIYAAAKRLSLLAPILSGSLVTAFLPKASALMGIGELHLYVRRVWSVAGLCLVPMGLLLLVSAPLVHMNYTSDYGPSLPVFKILLGAFSLTLWIYPMGLLMYALHRPQMMALVHGVQLVVNFVGNLFLIPLYGSKGAAMATLASTLTLGGLVAGWMYVRLRGEHRA